MDFPSNLKYTKDHEWIRVEGSSGVVGITEYAQGELGDVVFVELPKPGDHVTAAESFGTVESVKAVSEIFSPVTGEVTASNSKLQNTPELVNSDPHGEGWLIKVQLADRREIDKLMTADEYETYIKQEKAH
jgi:glycine cleavage system H protein